MRDTGVQGHWKNGRLLNGIERGGSRSDLDVALARQVAARVGRLLRGDVAMMVMVGRRLRESIGGMMMRRRVLGLRARREHAAIGVRPGNHDAACGDVRQPGDTQHGRNPAATPQMSEASHPVHIGINSAANPVPPIFAGVQAGERCTRERATEFIMHLVQGRALRKSHALLVVCRRPWTDFAEPAAGLDDACGNGGLQRDRADRQERAEGRDVIKPAA